MDTEQAMMAAPSTEAAPTDGAENQREETMNALLSQMSADEDGSEPVLEEEAAEPEAQEEEVPKAKNFRGRWDHLDDQERRVVELTAKKGLTLNEAFRAVYGEDQPEPPAASEAPGGALEERIAGQQEKLDDLKRRKAEARGDLAEYDKAADAYFEAREELRELQAERRRQRELEAAEALAAHRGAEAQAEAALLEEYPDALTPGTELFEACREELRYLEEAKSPLVRDPQVLYKVARRFARTLGLEKSPSRRRARPVPANAAPLETPVAALERKLSGARSTSAMLELMREIGTPFEALLKR